MTRYLLLYDSYSLVIVGRPLWQENPLFHNEHSFYSVFISPIYITSLLYVYLHGSIFPVVIKFAVKKYAEYIRADYLS
jgi:hypothetical protein